jgi:hypothetical protein
VAPLADDLAWGIESRSNGVVSDILSSEQDDLGANDISIR